MSSAVLLERRVAPRKERLPRSATGPQTSRERSKSGEATVKPKPADLSSSAEPSTEMTVCASCDHALAGRGAGRPMGLRRGRGRLRVSVETALPARQRR